MRSSYPTPYPLPHSTPPRPSLLAGVLCPERFSSCELLQQHNDLAHPYRPDDASSSDAADSALPSSSSRLSHALQTEPPSAPFRLPGKRPLPVATVVEAVVVEEEVDEESEEQLQEAQEQRSATVTATTRSLLSLAQTCVPITRTRARVAALRFWEGAKGKHVVLHLYEKCAH